MSIGKSTSAWREESLLRGFEDLLVTHRFFLLARHWVRLSKLEPEIYDTFVSVDNLGQVELVLVGEMTLLVDIPVIEVTAQGSQE